MNREPGSKWNEEDAIAHLVVLIGWSLLESWHVPTGLTTQKFCRGLRLYFTWCMLCYPSLHVTFGLLGLRVFCLLFLLLYLPKLHRFFHRADRCAWARSWLICPWCFELVLRSCLSSKKSVLILVSIFKSGSVCPRDEFTGISCC